MRVILNLLLFALLNYPVFAMADGGAQLWSKTEHNGKIKTERTYADTFGVRRVDVTSQCVNGPSSELHFGVCSHKIALSPGGVNLTLNHGEVVFLAANGEVATYEYGCCGDPGEVLFYNDSGKVIGKTHSYKTPNPSFSTRQNDIGSVSRSQYLLVDKNLNQKSLDHDEFELIDSKRSDFRQTVKLNIPEKIKRKECGWTQRLAVLNDKKELYIVFDTLECSLREIRSTCSLKNGIWDCKLIFIE